jgi:hypothetical protein
LLAFADSIGWGFNLTRAMLELQMGFYVYIFYVSKLYEYMDTVRLRAT